MPFRIKFILATGATLALIMELVALAGLLILEPQPTDLASTLKTTLDEQTLLKEKWLSEGRWKHQTPHPYFGYHMTQKSLTTYELAESGFVRSGFMNLSKINSADLKNKNKVGIFGGSLALLLSLHLQEKTTPDWPFLPLNFSIGASKQPQHFAVFSQVEESLSQVLILDGLNEILYIPETPFPPHYPYFSPLFYNDSVSDRRKFGYLQLISDTSDKLATIPQLFSVQLLRRLLERHASHTVTQIKKRDVNNGERLSDSRIRSSIQAWENFTRKSWLLAKAQGIPFCHFLQPSLYYKKPLSVEEKQLFSDFFAKAGQYYGELESVSKKLRTEGIPTYSLADIFEKQRDSRYVDSIGHLNKKGYQEIWQKITQLCPTLSRL